MLLNDAILNMKPKAFAEHQSNAIIRAVISWITFI